MTNLTLTDHKQLVTDMGENVDAAWKRYDAKPREQKQRFSVPSWLVSQIVYHKVAMQLYIEALEAQLAESEKAK